VEINPEEAKRLNIADGEYVTVVSRRGEIKIAARVTDNVPAGLVYIPMHFSECAANILTADAPLDPKSKIPPYKYCCVNIEKNI
jgi:anaerobic selenocysteine-containing dehydrogenase